MKPSYFEKIEFFLLAVFLPSLVFTVRLNAIILFLLALNWFVYSLLIGKFKVSKNKKYLWFIIAFFCLYLLQLFRAEDLGRGWLSVEKRLSILGLPVIFCYSITDKRELKDIFLFGFVGSIFIASLLSFYKTSSIYFVGLPHLGVVFESLVMHKAYFALYCLSSIYILFYYSFRKNTIVIWVICVLLSVHFFLFSVLTVAKMALIAFVLSLFVLLLFLLYNKKSYYIFYLLTFLCFIFSITFFWFFPQIEDYVFDAAKNRSHTFNEYFVNIFISTSQRVIMWECSIQGLKENYNWLLGMGLGDNINNYLNSCYIANGKESMASIGYNSHNQFLHTWLLNGILGIFLLLINLLIVPVLAVKKKDLLSFALFIFFIICLFTESMFAVQKGVVYFSFFYSMLLYTND